MFALTSLPEVERPYPWLVSINYITLSLPVGMRMYAAHFKARATTTLIPL